MSTLPTPSCALAKRRPGRRLPGLVLALSAALLGACGINNIPSYDEAADAAWSEVQNQYQRRSDLVPNLVATVEGFAAQESEVLKQVTEARSRVAQTNVSPETLTDPAEFQRFQQNQDALGSALQRLMVVVEAYPELKSNANFLALQDQLEGTENRIAVARGDYVESVRRYNTELRTVPGRWWRAFMYSDMEPRQSFTAAPGSETAPAVDFSN